MTVPLERAFELHSIQHSYHIVSFQALSSFDCYRLSDANIDGGQRAELCAILQPVGYEVHALGLIRAIAFNRSSRCRAAFHVLGGFIRFRVRRSWHAQNTIRHVSRSPDSFPASVHVAKVSPLFERTSCSIVLSSVRFRQRLRLLADPCLPYHLRYRHSNLRLHSAVA